MDDAHDRASGPLVPPSEFSGGTDPLSDVLAEVHLTGALFFLIEASAPWGVEVPEAAAYRDRVLPGAQHVVSFDAVLEGGGWVEIEGAEPVHFEAGDVLVFARSPPHRLVSAPGERAEFDAAATVAFLCEMARGRLPFATREGGGGRLTRYVCGYLGCDIRPFNPVLAALPAFLHLRRGPDASADGTGLLDRLIELTLAEATTERPGGQSIRLRLAELTFVEVVRRHMAAMGPEATGWLAGLRDPVAGRALALLHARPAEAWTLDGLAREVAVSRSVLAERFAHLVGCPPLRYLARWRMQRAARMLRGGARVAEAADAVGYASEAAFSRAFRRETGIPPSAWRAGAD
jgi:AraC-like DNA-binding protein